MADADAINQPSPALKGKYRVVGTTPGVCYTTKRERVDLRDIDLATADRLHAEGFEFLEPVEAEQSAAATTSEPEADAEKGEPKPPAPARTPRRRKTPAA